jgi:hypothetical protein
VHPEIWPLKTFATLDQQFWHIWFTYKTNFRVQKADDSCRVCSRMYP